MKIALAIFISSMLLAACGHTGYVGTQEYTEWVIENGR